MFNQFNNFRYWISQKSTWILLGPLLSISMGFILHAIGMHSKMAITCATSLWMILWWLTGPVRMGLTALLPIVIFPLFGILPGSSVSEPYFGDSIMIFLGSVLMALAVEQYGLHRRFARILLSCTRSHGDRGLLFGFIITTGVLSMWLSNSATAALMTPLAKAVFQTESGFAPQSDANEGIKIALDLGIAYAASLGGMATLTGTGSNIVLKGTMASMFHNQEDEISFIGWFLVACPLSLLNLSLLWALLTLWFLDKNMPPEVSFTQESINNIINRIFWSALPWSTYRRTESRTASSVASERSSNSPRSKPESLRDILEIEMTNMSAGANEQVEVKQGEQAAKLGVMSSLSMDLSDDENDRGQWSVENPMSVSASNCEESKGGPSSPPSAISADGSRGMPPRLPKFNPALITEMLQSDSEHDDDRVRFSFAEWVVLLAFVSMGLLWLTRNPPGNWGWANLFPNPNYITDGTVAMACSMLLFVLPVDPRTLFAMPGRSSGSATSEGGAGIDAQVPRGGRGVYVKTIMSWSVVQSLNWDVIFLLGGGFTLSQAFQATGLSLWLANFVSAYGPDNLPVLVFTASVLATAVTNVMSNVATANILLPTLACAGPARHHSPLMVLAPVAMSTSMAFMFPIGTPPNAIVMANGNLTVAIMAKVGAVATLMYLGTTLVFTLYLLPLILGSTVSEAVYEACSL